MKVLVTGANGFLAANIVRELNRRGLPVRAMVRPAADMRSLSGTDYELFHGTMTSMTDALQAVKGCDIVIHAAAETSQHYLKANDYFLTNVQGTRNILEASRQSSVRRFIFVSTANAFGYGTKACPGNEQHLSRYPFTLSGYAISKIKAQELVLEYADSGKQDAVVVNPTFMIGPYDTKPGSGKIITMMVNKKVIPVPPGGKNFIHVSDVANGICNAIIRGRNGQCYLLANENLSYGEFYEKLAEVSGRSYKQINLSRVIMYALGTMGTLAAKFGIRSNLHLINAKMLCIGNYYSSAKAVKELDLPQTPVGRAIADALDWFRA